MIFKRLVVVCCLWLFAAVCFAQTSEIDALRHELRDMRVDSTRVLLYIQLANAVSDSVFYDIVQDDVSAYELAKQYADSALSLAQDIGYKYGEAKTYQSFGRLSYFVSQFHEAILYYEMAYDTFSGLGDESGKATSVYNIALVYELQGKTVQALDHFLIAASIWELTENEDGMERSYVSISQMYKTIREYELAIEYGRKGMMLGMELKDTLNTAVSCGNIATSNLALHDTASAISLFDQAVKMLQGSKYKANLVDILLNYSKVYQKNEPVKAISLLRRAGNVFEINESKHYALTEVYKSLSDIYHKIKKQDSAAYYQRKALEIAVLSGDDWTIASAYLWTGSKYYEQKQFNQALRYLTLASEVNQKIGSAEVDTGVWFGMSRIYQQKGDQLAAYRALSRAVRISDSLSAEENRKRLEIIDFQYDYKYKQEQRERALQEEIILHQEQFAKRRKAIMGVALILVFLSILLGKFIINNRKNRQNNNLLLEQHEEITQTQEEIQQSNEELVRYKEHLEKTVREQIVKQSDQEAQLRILSTNLPGGIIYRKVVEKNGKTRYPFVSDSLARISDVPASKIKNPLSLLDDDVKKQIRKKEMECEKSMTALDMEFTFVKDNVRLWFYNHALPHKEKDGSMVWDGFIMNITRQKEVQVSLEKAKDKAEEADKLKSMFLANISHEIRTPMNAITGFLGFLEQKDLSKDKKNGYIRIIQKSADQLLELIDNIIDISKLDVHKMSIVPKSFDLNALMSELEAYYVGKIPEGKPVSLILGDRYTITPCVISADSTRLKQILDHLIDNAIKYTEKGYVMFGYQVKEQPSEVLFYIEDTGIGISADQQKSIFEYFTKGREAELQPKYSGTGLGLSISKGLVELMGGQIWVESAIGQGSTFYFTIPISSDTPLQADGQ